MQFLQYQILDMKDIVYTTVPSSSQNEDTLQAFEMLRTCPGQREAARRHVIEFPDDGGDLLIGISNSVLEEKASERLWLQGRILLESAVKARYEGAWEKVTDGIERLDGYIQENGFRANAPVYGVLQTKIREPEDMDSVVIDLYAGVDRSVLFARTA